MAMGGQCHIPAALHQGKNLLTQCIPALSRTAIIVILF